MLHYLGALSLLIYLLSFAAPYKGDEFGGGAVLFFYGLLFCWHLPLSFAWWANVLYWFALRNALRGRWGRVAVWAVAATVLSSSFLLINGPGTQPPTAPAFWMWVASMAVMAVAGLAGWLLAGVKAVDAAEQE